MKKLLKFLPLMLAAVMGVALMSCSDKEEFVDADALPQTAKSFLLQYYPGTEVISTTKDKDEYSVILKNGTQIDFDKKGDWTGVDSPIGVVVPTGFYPAAIDAYIAEKFPEQGGINDISKEKRGYDVELVGGTELVFNYDGQFIGIDN